MEPPAPSSGPRFVEPACGRVVALGRLVLAWQAHAKPELHRAPAVKATVSPPSAGQSRKVLWRLWPCSLHTQPTKLLLANSFGLGVLGFPRVVGTCRALGTVDAGVAGAANLVSGQEGRQVDRKHFLR